MENHQNNDLKSEEIYENIDECVQRNINARNTKFQAKQSCISVDLPGASATAKRVLKTSTDKLCGTFNNVCTKFETLSQVRLLKIVLILVWSHSKKGTSKERTSCTCTDFGAHHTYLLQQMHQNHIKTAAKNTHSCV